MGVFEEMMKQYQEAHGNGSANKSEKKYDLKNYFNSTLPQGVSTLKKKFRILPPSEGQKTSFQTMWGHVKKIDGAWKTFPCLKHEKGEDCPYCEAREVLLASGNEDEKEMAKEYSARRFYIVKLIDRDNEADGPKFWRFKHNYKKDGIYDKIMSAIEDCAHDITDVETGRDLILTIKKGSNGNTTTIGYALEASPLSTDESLVNKWTSDTRTWEAVYSVRNYEYLAITAKGQTPFWDKDNDCWAAKADKETENTTDVEIVDDEIELDELPEPKAPAQTTKLTSKPTTTTSETKTTKKVEITSEDDEDDELPF